VTGELQYRYPPHYGDPKYQEIRARRTVLQAALLSAVPKSIIQLRKRLIRLEPLIQGGSRLLFDDGSAVEADLVVGADGLRSVS
jgi:salicylate hydroxylase